MRVSQSGDRSAVQLQLQGQRHGGWRDHKRVERLDSGSVRQRLCPTCSFGSRTKIVTAPSSFGSYVYNLKCDGGDVPQSCSVDDGYGKNCIVNVVECLSDNDCTTDPAKPTCDITTNLCTVGHGSCRYDYQCEGWYGNSCCQLQSDLPTRTMYASECSSGVVESGSCQYVCVVKGTVLGPYICRT